MEKNIAFCPDCAGEIRFKKSPFLGQLITCRHCTAELVVAEKSPIELDWADSDDVDLLDWEDEVEEVDDRHSRFNRR